MIVRLFKMIKSSRPFQDACHIVPSQAPYNYQCGKKCTRVFCVVADEFTLQLTLWQEMHRGSQSHCRPTLCPSLAGQLVLPGQPTTIFPLAIQIKCENVSKELVLIGYPCWHWCHMKFSIHQSSQFTLPLPMWQEMCKGLLCPIRFVHLTSTL